MLAKILSKNLDFLGLSPFFSRHTQGEPYDDLFHVMLPDESMEVVQVVFLVLSMQRVQTLRSDSQGIRNGDSDTAGSDIQAEDAMSGFHWPNYRVSEGSA